MKNATEYGKRVKKLLAGLKRKHSPPPANGELTPLELLALAVLRRDLPRDQAHKALKQLDDEFVDFNEMRVAPPKDIVELLGEDVPDPRGRAERLTIALGKLFEQDPNLNMEFLRDCGKRELKAQLQDGLGLDSFAEAFLTLYLTDVVAVPVDQALVDRLKEEDLVGEDAEVDDTRAMIERIATKADSFMTFELLNLYSHEPAPARKTPKKTAEKKTDTSKTKAKAAGKAKKSSKKSKAAKKTKQSRTRSKK